MGYKSLGKVDQIVMRGERKTDRGGFCLKWWIPAIAKRVETRLAHCAQWRGMVRPEVPEVLLHGTPLRRLEGVEVRVDQS